MKNRAAIVRLRPLYNNGNIIGTIGQGSEQKEEEGKSGERNPFGESPEEFVETLK